MSKPAIELASLAGGRNPQVELMLAGYYSGQPGEDAETHNRIEKRLVVLHQQGEKQAAYLLGRLYLEGAQNSGGSHKAENWLKQSTELPEASYLLGRLCTSGMLDGELRVQEGINLLVKAAREGYSKADVAWVDAFLHTPGIKANPVYAWALPPLALEQRSTAAKSGSK